MCNFMSHAPWSFLPKEVSMRRLHHSSSYSRSSSAPVAFELLEARCLMSVSATGLSGGSVVAGKAKAFTLASFTTTDTKPKARNFTATINFEDGTSAKGTIKAAKGHFSVVGTHKYVAPLTFAPEITINDKTDGTSQTVTGSVAVTPSHNSKGFTQFVGAHAKEFQAAYGGTWQQVGNNFKSKRLTATRISDSSDIIWSGDVVSAVAIGAYSTSAQTFGYVPGNSGGTYVNLFDVTGSNASVNGGVGPTTMPATYRLARYGGFLPLLTSDPADNVDGRDHLISYVLEGLAGQPANETTYVLFFEDTPSVTSDFDFDDMVVQLTLQK
jgi:hypothetical protein